MLLVVHFWPIQTISQPVERMSLRNRVDPSGFAGGIVIGALLFGTSLLRFRHRLPPRHPPRHRRLLRHPCPSYRHHHNTRRSFFSIPFVYKYHMIPFSPSPKATTSRQRPLPICHVSISAEVLIMMYNFAGLLLQRIPVIQRTFDDVDIFHAKAVRLPSAPSISNARHSLTPSAAFSPGAVPSFARRT
ncbi:hypothetical protein FA95DRAFT_408063 [Auriscalpium vulgare]|uniref:Uncharacterized protein n=1 Tax=Auriscalpium vulgare TaxID=40419 RepID=A0ACB8RIM0_9AGAM|nr:hypothetical protein FA95DRAFT_408063 [Auriscalpium vulgare]